MQLRPAFVIALLTGLLGNGPCEAFEPAVQLREPIDAAWSVPGQQLVTANRQSQTLSLIDVQRGRVVEEFPLDFEPAAIVSWDQPLHFAVLDASRQRIVWLAIDREGQFHVASAIAVGRGPMSLCRVTPEVWSVTSRWDRTVESLRLNDSVWPPTLQERRSVTLSFAPGLQLAILDGKKVVVTDTHADQLAVIDVATWQVESTRRVQGHNIRGLAVSADGTSLLLAQQLLNEQVATSRDAVRDGILLQNVVRSIPVRAVQQPRSPLAPLATTLFVGRVDEGAADPSDLVIGPDGDLLVALGGTDEVARLTPQGTERPRIAVGQRPTRLVSLPGQQPVIAVNTFSDSISIIDTAASRVSRQISLGPTPPLTPAQRGERLFFSGRLSLDRWMSCHSCHTDGHSNGALVDTFGDRTHGTPKRVLSLLGGRDANPWGWTGEARELHTQINNTIHSTMQQPPLPATQVNDLVAYLHTLEAAPPRHPATPEPSDQAQLRHGEQLFRRVGCAGCHIPPLTFTSDGTFEVGLTDEAGRTKFNPPSLLGVSQRDGYFHDGSARSLNEVLDSGHFTEHTWTTEERTALIRYLESL